MADSAITVTLKAGKGYESHWAVFKGDSAHEVRHQVIDYFLLEVDDSLSLHEVVLTAESVLQGGSNVVRTLGATPVSAEKVGGEKKAEPEPVAESASDSEQSPAETLTERMLAAETVDDLRSLWVDNKELFNAHQEVKDAYSKRGKELTA